MGSSSRGRRERTGSELISTQRAPDARHVEIPIHRAATQKFPGKATDMVGALQRTGQKRADLRHGVRNQGHVVPGARRRCGPRGVLRTAEPGSGLNRGAGLSGATGAEAENQLRESIHGEVL